MPNYESIPMEAVAKALKKHLAIAAGWGGDPNLHILDNSRLYDDGIPQHARTAPSAVPVHFGFNNTSDVASAANAACRDLIGAILLFGENVLITADLQLQVFALLTHRLHLRLNGHLVDIIGRAVLYSIFIATGQKLRILDEVPWQGNPAFNQFIVKLGEELSDGFPWQIGGLTQNTITNLGGAKTIIELRDIVISEFVAPALKAKP